MKAETLAEVKKNIAEADKKLSEMREDINKARNAGLDVKEQETTFSELSKKVSLLKSAYL